MQAHETAFRNGSAHQQAKYDEYPSSSSSLSPFTPPMDEGNPEFASTALRAFMDSIMAGGPEIEENITNLINAITRTEDHDQSQIRTEVDHCFGVLLAYGSETFGNGIAGIPLWDAVIRINSALESPIVNIGYDGTGESRIFVVGGKQYTVKDNTMPYLRPSLDYDSHQLQIAATQLEEHLTLLTLKGIEWHKPRALIGQARFGWAEKSIEVIHVIGAEIGKVEWTSSIPIMQAYGTCELASTSPATAAQDTLLSKANNLLYGQGASSEDRATRTQLLKKASGIRGELLPPPIVPGQSIGGEDMLSVGSMCIAISPLQATNILEKALNWSGVLGTVIAADLGCDHDGNRSDFAIIESEDELVRNDQWYSEEETNDVICTVMGKDIKVQDMNISCVRDAAAGDVIFKEGASTGTTVGKAGPGHSIIFEKRSNTPSDAALPLVDRCKMSEMWPMDRTSVAEMALSGDSGGPVLAIGESGISFVGMVVAVYHPEFPLGQSIALYISGSVLFNQLQEHTGVSWKLQ
ncbi:hypothetical protein DFH27DRAFT_653664 [Peziza echinospora]|nr:hypothetical protein DFH27DRAFT_653664 [Peziza echinospora]